MVTRAVGASADLFVEMDVLDLKHGDKYLLCSDGLDKHVADVEMAQILAKGGPEAVAKALIELTLARGATDNVTVSVVEVQENRATAQASTAA